MHGRIMGSRANRAVLLAAVALTLSGVVAACAPMPAPQSTVDQVWSPNDPSGVNTDRCSGPILTRAQTFTAGRTGVLDKVSLSIDGTGSPVVRIQIRDTVGGLPGPTVLGSGTYAGPFNGLAPTGGSAVFTDMPLATPASVTAGTQYALTIVPEAGCTGEYRTDFSLFAPFTGGAGFTTTTTSSAFVPLFGSVGSNANLLFRTWVR